MEIVIHSFYDIKLGVVGVETESHKKKSRPRKLNENANSAREESRNGNHFLKMLSNIKRRHMPD